MSHKIPPLDVHKLLPRTNCVKCGEDTCFAFATKLADRKVELSLCTPLFEEDRYKENVAQLRDLLRPAVREVRVTSPSQTARIGGKTVMYRHDLRYDNPTAIAVSVTDEMPEEEMLAKIKKVSDFQYRYIGKDLTLDMVAVRCTSDDANQFEETVNKVVEATDMPLVLCSFDPKILERGLLAAGGGKPLLYAATKDNWKELRDLALKYDCPVAVYEPNDLSLLRSLSKTFLQSGIENIALDPGSAFGEGIRNTVNKFTMLRRLACEREDDLLAFPLIGTPIGVRDEGNDEEVVTKWNESCLASMLLLRYADLLILDSADPWVILPLIILRENIYTDPVKPVTVDPGLYTFGEPTEDSPVMYTTNFALTFFIVREDLKDLACYLLVIETEGTSVESSVAGGRLTADKIAEAIKDSGIEEKVNHRKLISPGLAARLSGETEVASGWEVLVGPKDSAGIKEFVEKKFYQSETSNS